MQIFLLLECHCIHLLSLIEVQITYCSYAGEIPNILCIVWSLDFHGSHVKCTTDSVTSKNSSLWLQSGFQTCANLLCSMQSPVVQFLFLLCQVKKKKKALRLLKSLNKKKAFTLSFFLFFSLCHHVLLQGFFLSYTAIRSLSSMN